jgi:hypothetical protein
LKVVTEKITGQVNGMIEKVNGITDIVRSRQQAVSSRCYIVNGCARDANGKVAVAIPFFIG